MEAARYVDELARTWGFDSELVETEPGRGNVLITADAGGPKSLMLSGHLDTKAMGETEAEWDTPPLEVTVHDGLAYGLGTSDMKGAVAAMLVAARKWSESAKTGRLSLVFTADEEAGSRHGAQALCERGLVEADAALIGEPSGIDVPWEAMYLVSRGHLPLRCRGRRSARTQWPLRAPADQRHRCRLPGGDGPRRRTGTSFRAAPRLRLSAHGKRGRSYRGRRLLRCSPRPCDRQVRRAPRAGDEP